MLTNKKIINIIKNGGITFKLKEEEGFMVSLASYEKIINYDIIKFKDTYKYYKKLIKQLNKNLHLKDLYIGVWCEKNKIYFDISQHFNNKNVAIAVGEKNKQVSIYDISSNECIYLK